MKKITIEEALLFAKNNFPQAPEKLVEHLEIELRYSPMPCDGWSLRSGDRSIIRINSKMPKVRKRFTLAHELGHLVYDIPAVIGENIYDIKNKTDIERKIDNFASKLLLPESIVIEEIKEIPVTAKSLKKLTKKAKTSQPSAALRVASLSAILGLDSAWVLFFENEKLKWQHPRYPKTDEWANDLLKDTMEVYPNPFRFHNIDNKNLIVSVILENPNFNTTILFLQILNEKDGLKELKEERIRSLEKQLFNDDLTFRQSMNGKFSSFKKTAQDLDIEGAIEKFYIKYTELYPGALTAENIKILKSDIGKEYVLLRLRIWTRN